MGDFKSGRQFVKSNWASTSGPEFSSPQAQGLPMPSMQKAAAATSVLIDLPLWSDQEVSCSDLAELLITGRSRRQFSTRDLTLNELSYLLYMADGLVEIVGDGKASRRTAPSGGARHPFETYLAINRVEGLKPGIYRHLFLSNQLELCFEDESLEQKLTEATMGQKFCGMAPVTFIWSNIPARGEWRYHVRAAKLALLDIGHVCQNLYLACESIGLGTCALAAYDQEAMDRVISVDGEEEFVLYMAPVGAIA